MKSLLVISLVLALAGQSLWAAAPGDAKHIAKIRGKVSQYLDDGRYVSVETYDHRKMAGTISQAGQDDFVLAGASGLLTLEYGNVKKIKAPMDARTRSVIATTAVLAALFGTLLIAAAHDK